MRFKQETVATIDLAWAVKAFGSMTNAIEMAEAGAKQLLQNQHDASLSWAEDYLSQISSLQHEGNCSVCRAWLRGPLTCEACVYDELMLASWLEMKARLEK